MGSKSLSLLGVVSVLVLSGLIWTAAVWAQAPNVISYSGTLTDVLGQPTDGQLDLTFRIYDHPVEGIPQRQPLYTQPIRQVPVRNGQFTVLLGPFTDPNVFVQGAGERYVGSAGGERNATLAAPAGSQRALCLAHWVD